MSWQDQGRQEHGWFGSGTASQQPNTAAGDRKLFGPGGASQRIGAIAYGALAALPRTLRGRAATQLDAGTVSRLTELMTAWIQGAKLDEASFAEKFFGRAADDAIVAKLRSAAQSADMGKSHAELRAAAGQLADAMQAIGIDRWKRFLADAQARPREPATVVAVEQSRRPPDLAGDAIRPVYPLEGLLTILAGGATAGVAGAVRAAGLAGLRQITPRGLAGAPEPSTSPVQSRPITTEVLPGKQGKHIAGSSNFNPTRGTLTGDPKALLKKFAGRGEQVGRIPVGHPGSKERFDAGETIGIWRTRTECRHPRVEV